MKFGIRKISIKKRISARISPKRMLVHRLGLKMPRGLGILRNPKKTIYNKIYNRTTFSLTNPPKFSKRKKDEKPEWLVQEEKNKEFFRSDEGLSPINILREKAKEYEKKRNFLKAEELYEKIAKMSRMGFDYCALGDIYYKQDKFKEAIKSYKEAIKLEPIAPYPKNAIEKVKRKAKKKNRLF